MGNYRNFSLATYFVAQATARITREELEKQLDFMLRHLRLDKVYLEPHRNGTDVAEAQLRMIKDYLEGKGVTVSGGIYGKVHSVGDTTVDVEVSNGVIMTVEKSMIQPTADNNNAR